VYYNGQKSSDRIEAYLDIEENEVSWKHIYFAPLEKEKS